MAKHTIAELQSKIKLLESLNEDLQKERAKLKATLNNVIEDKGVVLQADYDTLLSNYKKLEERYKHLHKMYTADPNTKDRLTIENIRLKATVNNLEVKSARKHNERGAGRKRLPIEQAVAEHRSAGMTVKEIAETLGVGTATINRVLKKLRDNDNNVS